MTRDLFFNLFWPAMAGNVAWSFFSLLVDNGWSGDESVRPRLVVLGLIAWYMAHEWSRNQERNDDVYPTYWIFDAALLATTVMFALAAEAGHQRLELLLVVILVVIVAGHIIGAWMEKERDTDSNEFVDWKKRWKSTWPMRIALALANAVGFVALCGIPRGGWVQSDWTPAVAVACVLIAWYVVTFVINPYLERKLADKPNA